MERKRKARGGTAFYYVCSLHQQDKLRSWMVGVADGNRSGRGVNGGGFGGLSRQSSGIVRVLFWQDSAPCHFDCDINQPQICDAITHWFYFPAPRIRKAPRGAGQGEFSEYCSEWLFVLPSQWNNIIFIRKLPHMFPQRIRQKNVDVKGPVCKI